MAGKNNSKKPTKANWQDAFAKKNVGLDDMTLLSKVKNEDINDNLQKRFHAGFIYTYIGHVLIAVNPYRDLGLYTNDILHSYYGKNRIEMPPHVYAVGEAAFHQMVSYQENQCVIISGESGAGKTESAKKIMEYIAAVSAGNGAGVDHVRQIVLATNPLLEAFGNAKTLRNNNSSRFGKYFEIEFSRAGEPLGGVITNYLLEKGRVVAQIKGERNFHIFYNYARGATAQQRKDFQIQGPENYNYTSLSGCLNVDGMNDVEDFHEVLNAMNVIGISDYEQYNLFQLLAAILWTGNISFKDQGTNGCKVVDQTVVDMVGYLLEINPVVLNQVFMSRVMETSRGGQRATTYNVPLNAAQASAVRDALSKAIYSRIFDWIVQRINQAMVQNKTEKLVIGVLDIYGFEVFEHNSFEQLCINYVNEKLQQIFIELTLKQEQEEYVREKIKWTPIDFFNNKVVCDLIEEAKRPPGIFAVMDDACATAHADPEAADKALMQRLGTLSGNAHFKDLGQAGFLIKHYAGDVTYEAAGMTDKNKDQLVFDLLEAIQMTSNKFLRALFPDEVDRNSKKRPTTASTKIKQSCNELVTALSRCTPHYIRCIKPNDNKSSSEYDQRRCIHQIKYLGLLENIRVRRAGFAYRQIFEKFLEHFFLLSRRTSYAGEFIWQGDAMSGCRCICEDCGISREEWQIGTTKVFIRSPETLWALEHLRERYWHNMAMRIQRAYRNYVRYKNECASRIQRIWRSWNNTKVYLQVRDYGHQVLRNLKERRRFSLLSMRRFMGDYLDFRTNPVLQQACGTAIHEGVIFSAKAQILVHRLLKGPKFYPRFVVMTKSAIYIVETKIEKNLAVTTLERRIPLQSIRSIGFSPHMDDAIILFVPGESDVVLTCMFKTEFATHIAWQAGGNIDVQVNSIIEYNKKPNKKAEIKFAKDETARNEHIFKKGTLSIATGQSPNSVSDPPCRRNDKPARPITTGKLLRKGGPSQQQSAPRSAPAPKATVAAAAKQAPAQAGGYAAKAIPAQPPAKAAPSAPSKPTFKALFAYEKQEEGELSFPVGGILEILEKDENGWWNARYNGQEGWVPSNYLEEIKAPPPAAAPAPKPIPKPVPKPAEPEPAAAFRPAPKPAMAAASEAPQFRPPMMRPPARSNDSESGPASAPKPKPMVPAAAGTPAVVPKPAIGAPPAAPKPMGARPPGAVSPPVVESAAPRPVVPKPAPVVPKPMNASAAAPAAAPKPAAVPPRPSPPSAAAPKPMMPPKPAVVPPAQAASRPAAAPHALSPKPTPKPVAAPKPSTGLAAVPGWRPQRPPSDDEDDGSWD